MKYSFTTVTQCHWYLQMRFDNCSKFHLVYWDHLIRPLPLAAFWLFIAHYVHRKATNYLFPVVAICISPLSSKISSVCFMPGIMVAKHITQKPHCNQCPNAIYPGIGLGHSSIRYWSLQFWQKCCHFESLYWWVDLRLLLSIVINQKALLRHGNCFLLCKSEIACPSSCPTPRCLCIIPLCLVCLNIRPEFQILSCHWAWQRDWSVLHFFVLSHTVTPAKKMESAVRKNGSLNNNIIVPMLPIQPPLRIDAVFANPP